MIVSVGSVRWRGQVNRSEVRGCGSAQEEVPTLPGGTDDLANGALLWWRKSANGHLENIPQVILIYSLPLSHQKTMNYSLKVTFYYKKLHFISLEKEGKESPIILMPPHIQHWHMMPPIFFLVYLVLVVLIALIIVYVYSLHFCLTLALGIFTTLFS